MSAHSCVCVQVCVRHMVSVGLHVCRCVRHVVSVHVCVSCEHVGVRGLSDGAVGAGVSLCPGGPHPRGEVSTLPTEVTGSQCPERLGL